MVSGAIRWDPERYAATARFVTELGRPVLEWLAPRAGERILDLGCGDGLLMAELAALGCAVVGIDASAEMVEAARARGLDARVMDAQALAFDGGFDAVYSNAALHWMPQAGSVIGGVRRALVPGGRFVGEFGGAGNVAGICAALNAARARRGLPSVSPWFNPSPVEYRAMLEAGGFSVERLEHFPRPTPLPGPLGDWLQTFTGAFLEAVPRAEHAALLAEALERLRATHLGPDGAWRVDYVRLRFAARRALD
ncbi:MAG: class I SAM-dependent methyltransferase [Gammaproteobacteria bacterium]|nr:class I SAM-dependent methyltransferase [Gammaproteobacteria bacterium]